MSKSAALETIQLPAAVLMAAMDQMANAVTITDRNGVIVYVNAAFSQLTGYTLQEVLGKTPRILKSGREDGRFYEEMWNHLVSGNVWEGALTNRKKDGSLYVDEMTISPILTNRREIAYFVAVRKDISLRVESERKTIVRAEELALPRRMGLLTEAAQTKQDLFTIGLDVLLSLYECTSLSRGVVFEVDAASRTLRLVLTRGTFSEQFLQDEAVIPFGECLCGRAAVEGQVLICQSCFTDSRHDRRWVGMRAHGHFTLPVRAHGRVVAVFTVYTGTSIAAVDRRRALLAHLGHLLGLGYERLQPCSSHTSASGQ